MNKIIKLLVLVGLAFLMLGCVEMLTSNIFAGLDKPRIPSVERIGTMEEDELLATVGNLIESDSFFADLIEEAELADDGISDTKDAILVRLNEIIDGSGTEATPGERQAALLVAEIELNTTAAGGVVDNFVAVAPGLIDGTVDTSDTSALAETIIGDVFDDVTTSEEFNAALDALLAAAAAYTFYGESLDDGGTVAAPDGDNIGAIAQDAVVAILIAEVLDPATGLDPADLEAFVLDPLVTTLPPFTLVGDPLTDNTAMANIIEASGLGELLGIGGTV